MTLIRLCVSPSRAVAADSAPAIRPGHFDFSCDSCRLALLSQPELGTNFSQIQAKIKSAPNPAPFIEQLGWEYVKKARSENDPGYYKLAELCARCWESNAPSSTEPLLLKGHVFHSLHRFAEAEAIAEKLTVQRGSPYDFGLLGDARYDLGNVAGAILAYQKMMDLKPDAHAYLRAGQVRWIKGDLEGASEMCLRAVQSSNPNDPESAAWMRAKLAALLWQMEDMDGAGQMLEEAIRMDPRHAAALHLKGKLLLSRNQTQEAISFLERAARSHPLPEYLWTLADAQRALGQEKQSAETEAGLLKKGAAMDPRSFSLYLATRKSHLEDSVLYARRELKERQDIFSHDALAWALFNSGKSEEAGKEMTMALAENTIDARLCLHAALIFNTSSHDKSLKLAEAAMRFSGLLQPSEKALLDAFQKQFGSHTADSMPVNNTDKL